MEILENGYVELSKSFDNNNPFDIDDIKIIKRNENNHIKKIRSLINEYSTSMYKSCFKLLCQKDIEDIVIIIPEHKREEYNFLEKEDWVFFDKYTEKIYCLDKNLISV